MVKNKLRVIIHIYAPFQITFDTNVIFLSNCLLFCKRCTVLFIFSVNHSITVLGSGISFDVRRFIIIYIGKELAAVNRTLYSLGVDKCNYDRKLLSRWQKISNERLSKSPNYNFDGETPHASLYGKLSNRWYNSFYTRWYTKVHDAKQHSSELKTRKSELVLVGHGNRWIEDGKSQEIVCSSFCIRTMRIIKS